MFPNISTVEPRSCPNILNHVQGQTASSLFVSFAKSCADASSFARSANGSKLLFLKLLAFVFSTKFKLNLNLR